MEHFEQLAISSAPSAPSIWYRYVDDTFLKIARDKVDIFTQHINNLDNNIKFTCDPEKDHKLPFFDTLVTRNSDGSVKVSVCRKATHTDQYLDFHSHIPLEHKINVVRTLMHRAETTVTEPCDLKVVKEHIKSALKVRGYEDWIFSTSCKEKTASSNIRKFFATLPYI